MALRSIVVEVRLVKCSRLGGVQVQYMPRCQCTCIKTEDFKKQAVRDLCGTPMSSYI